MINTIFYFAPNLDDYLDKWGHGKIGQNVICLVPTSSDEGDIYKNGIRYGTSLKEINSNIDIAIEEQKDNIEEMINNIINGKGFINGWQADWDSNIKAYLIQAGILGDDGVSKGWAYLETKYNEIKGEIDSLNILTGEDGEPLTLEAIQSIIDGRIENHSAITQLESRYALTDADQKVLKWLTAGFYSEANANKSVSQVFASASDASSATSALSTLTARVDALENGDLISSIDLSSYVKTEDIDGLVNTSISGLMTENSTNSAVSELFSRLKSLESATGDEETGLAALKLRIDNLSGTNGDFLTEASLVAAITNKKDDIVTTLSSAGLVNTATLNSAKTELEAKVGNAKTEILGEVANDYATTETVAKIIDDNGNIKAQAIASAIADSEGATSTLRTYFATTMDGEEIASGVTNKIASDLGQADWQTAAQYIKDELTANSTFRTNASSTYATASQLASLSSQVDSLDSSIPDEQDILDAIDGNKELVAQYLRNYFDAKGASSGLTTRVQELENAGFVASSDLVSKIVDNKETIISQAGLAAKADVTGARSALEAQIDNVQSSVVSETRIKELAKSEAGDVLTEWESTAGLVVQADLDGYVKKASILTSINSSGESNVKISADKIDVEGIFNARTIIADELYTTYEYNGGYAQLNITRGELEQVKGAGDTSETVTRFSSDGSGFLANGNFSWDTSGNVTIGDWSQGFSFDKGGLSFEVDSSRSILNANSFQVVDSESNVSFVVKAAGTSLDSNYYDIYLQGSTYFEGETYFNDGISADSLVVANDSTFNGAIFANNLDVSSAEIDTLTGGSDGINVNSWIILNRTAEFKSDVDCLAATVLAKNISTDPGSTLSLAGDTEINIRSMSGKVVLNASTEITANMNITVSSDETQKDILGTVAPAIEDIAKVRVVDYQLKSDDKKVTHTGTIAQDWQTLVPNAVITTGDGTLALDYSAVAVAASVAAAKEIVALKQENQELKQQLANIYERLAILENK